MRSAERRAALVDRLWYGTGAIAGAARVLLTPLAAAYGGAAAARTALYDRGWLPVHSGPLPAISVGNLTVGGTGKTPVAAWLVGRLGERGARPAVVLRGYGEDEPLVHARLNPGAPIVVAADRVAGIAAARARGADVAVLDDAFQHRRASRVADVVLLSADRWTGSARLLPAGPFREPLRGLRRASMVLITSKAATAAQIEALEAAVRRVAAAVPMGVAALRPAGLTLADSGETAPLGDIAGRRVLAVSAIGDPESFHRQLREADAIVEARAFPDHHPFSDHDLARLADEGRRADLVVCTLKDAVKIGPRWGNAPGLWYVTQAVTLQRGHAELDRLLTEVLRARA